jgi:hypothetical protein
MKNRAATPPTRLMPAWRCEAAPVDSGGLETSLVGAPLVSEAVVLSDEGTLIDLVGWITEELEMG